MARIKKDALVIDECDLVMGDTARDRREACRRRRGVVQSNFDLTIETRRIIDGLVVAINFYEERHVTQGQIVEEAIQGYLKVFKKKGRRIPSATTSNNPHGGRPRRW